mmetsp:Transcript_73880/g.175851  ORF Transcript_73880/g.175851 Transcript_73880/m.175851 type:complete len:256 (+) Transcript_73880:76-843(+)
MAAVITSLAAFVAGCSLPTLQLGLGGGRVARDSNHQDHDLTCVDAPSKERWCAAGAGSASLAAFGPGTTGQKAAVVVLQSPAGLPKSPRSQSGEGQRGKHWESSDGLLHPLRSRPGHQRRVRFDLSKSTIHEITPYAEVYGRHPRDFHFGRLAASSPCVDSTECETAYMIAAMPGKNVGVEDEDDDEAGEYLESLRPGQRTIWRLTLPWHLWFLILALCFCIRIFGLQLLSEFVLCLQDSAPTLQVLPTRPLQFH